MTPPAAENPAPTAAAAPQPADARRRVLIVTDTLANGGMERQLTLLATALARTHDVRVVSLSDGVYAPILRDAGIDLTVLPRSFRFDVRPAFPLARLVREWRPFVVNTYGWMSAASALFACRTSGTPLVDTSIRDAAVVTSGDRRVRALASRADVAIANSHAGLVAYGIDPEKGRVVHNGFDPARWELCSGGVQAERPFSAVMTARMHPHKDYRLLLDAARVLDAEDPGGWRFLAVGSGEERERLLADSADLRESGAVEFPDGGTEVLRLVRDCNVGVLLTDPEHHQEGISNSIMEFMACGLPVVCTDSGGNREIVVEGETGFIVGPRDLDAVLARLRALRDDPARAKAMGAAGRERIASVFTVERLVAGTLAAYELASERRRARRARG